MNTDITYSSLGFYLSIALLQRLSSLSGVVVWEKKRHQIRIDPSLLNTPTPFQLGDIERISATQKFQYVINNVDKWINTSISPDYFPWITWNINSLSLPLCLSLILFFYLYSQEQEEDEIQSKGLYSLLRGVL